MSGIPREQAYDLPSLVDIDILKPDTGIMPIERPSSTSNSTNESPIMRTPDPEHDHGSVRHLQYTEPVSEGEDDEEENNLVPAIDEGKRTGLGGAALEEAIAERRKLLQQLEEETNKQKAATGHTDSGEIESEDADEQSPLIQDRGRRRPSQPITSSTDKATRALSIDPLAPSQTFDETFKKLKAEVPISKQLRQRMAAADGAHSSRSGSRRARSQSRDAPDEASTNDTGEESPADRHREAAASTSAAGGDDRVLLRDWTAAPGKRIAVPVRVEPKVYFASERTFLVCLTSLLSSFLFIDIFASLLEMAPIRCAHRYNLDYPPQLHPSRGRCRPHRRLPLHPRCTSRYCLLRSHLRLPRA